ncbi:hypothetical protein [Mycobacteroides chelonae]|uniref:hypothetical protein n=1 Tax=Mycobacteroides chelonae TaxID=1774 RepID=UPI0008A9BD00|nr:hypothetical protein [Mycobacteroides chelonae]OHU29055.1 hypothetical protein BKG78_23590 [Mycobacteroides chelonae]
MNAQEIASNAVYDEYRKLPADRYPNEKTVAAAVLEALKANRFAVVEVPVVAHKGPYDTDASMYGSAARRLDDGYSMGGGNLRRAVAKLLAGIAEAMAS